MVRLRFPLMPFVGVFTLFCAAGCGHSPDGNGGISNTSVPNTTGVLARDGAGKEGQAQVDAVATKLRGNLVYTNAVRCVAFSPDGLLLAAGRGDGKVRLWTVEAGNDGVAPRVQRDFRAHADWVFAMDFSPDGRTLATGGGDNLIKLWDVVTGELMQTLEGHTGDLHAVVFTTDGRLLSGGDDRRVMLWDLAAGTHRVLGSHARQVTSLAISPDDRLLASANRLGTIRLWSLPEGEPLRTLEGHAADVLCVAFSPDGKMLASASYDRSIMLWNSDTGEQVRTLEGQHADWVFSVVFSPDGKQLASGAGDGIKLWNVAGGNAIADLQGQRHVAEVVFSPDGRLLASASASGTVCIWNPRSAKLLETLNFTDGLESRVSAATQQVDNVAADPNVYLKLHHTAMVPEDPSWSDTMGQLAHVGDGFMLEHAQLLRNLSAAQAATLQIALDRIQTRIAEEDASGLALVLASRLERAALADVNCDPLEGSLVPWTFRSIRAHVDQPVIRAELERIRSGYTPKTDAQSRFSSLEERVRSYAQRLLAGD